MFNKLIDWIVEWMAKIFPDNCPFRRAFYWGKKRLFTTPKLCGLNPLYGRVVKKKIENLGYDLDLLEDEQKL